jgi:hypothetical protein
MNEIGNDFAREAVRYLADRANCRCQATGLDVERNKHWQSCMVGRAQAHVGRRVTFTDGRKEWKA